MHSNELAQNYHGIVFGIGYLTLCKIWEGRWRRQPPGVGHDKPVGWGRVPRWIRHAILSIFHRVPANCRDVPLNGGRPCAQSEVTGLLEGEQVLGRQLLAFLEPLEDEFRLLLRVDLFRDFLRDAAALHPDSVDDLVVIVDLADVLDVLAVLLVREHLRLDELLLRTVGFPAKAVA